MSASSVALISVGQVVTDGTHFTGTHAVTAINTSTNTVTVDGWASTGFTNPASGASITFRHIETVESINLNKITITNSSQVKNNMSITGTNIPANTVITNVDTANNILTLSQNLTNMPNNSSLTIQVSNPPTAQTNAQISNTINPEDDNGRKYLYYKNDDCDKKVFYNAPLASLNRLSIQILDSRGRNLKDVWGDVDTTTNATSGVINTAFYNNTFIKDELINTQTSVDGRVTAITPTSVTTSNSPTADVYPSSTLVVNLTNQIEYIFEVTTKEKDLDGVFKAENL